MKRIVVSCNHNNQHVYIYTYAKRYPQRHREQMADAEFTLLICRLQLAPLITSDSSIVLQTFWHLF